MKKVIVMGRWTRDPMVRDSQGEKPMAVARYTLAVDRRFKREGEPTADFISCVAFGKQGEFAEKYLRKGTKIAVSGRMQTGSYTNRDGVKVYTTDVIVEDQEFADSKAASDRSRASFSMEEPDMGDRSAEPDMAKAPSDGFMNVPDGLEENLPFN